MTAEFSERYPGTPVENFSYGVLSVDIPELGPKKSGKVRENWVYNSYRVMVTTDRQSAYDRIIGTITGKGQALNLLSAFWFTRTKEIVPNHLIAVPHPNVMIAKQAAVTLPVEVVLRRYFAKSSTKTSIYRNYMEGRREIYGINFPEGLKPNQELPPELGTIVTPTTKSFGGHDEELNDEQARRIVDKIGGIGTWKKVKKAGVAVFEYSRALHRRQGLILVDTKYEFGLDDNGQIMIIDEMQTPDSSRFWLASTYQERFEKREQPDTFDKDILRRWLAARGFEGQGEVPRLTSEIVEEMAKAYKVPYQMIAGELLPSIQATQEEIRASVLQFFANC